MNNLLVPIDAPLREGTHVSSKCRTCKHIAEDMSFCGPLITRREHTEDGYNVVMECKGYVKETRRSG